MPSSSLFGPDLTFRAAFVCHIGQKTGMWEVPAFSSYANVLGDIFMGSSILASCGRR